VSDHEHDHEHARGSEHGMTTGPDDHATGPHAAAAPGSPGAARSADAAGGGGAAAGEDRGTSGAPLTEWTPQRLQRNAKQFVKFGLVGMSGVLVNLVVFNLTMRLWALLSGHEGGDLPLRVEYLANGLGFLVAVLSNYALNRRWTFQSTGRKRHELPKFFVVSVTAYAVNALVFHVCRVQLELAPNPSQLIAIVCVMPINFIFNKLWSFK
jgi:putative flippase GtrA